RRAEVFAAGVEDERVREIERVVDDRAGLDVPGEVACFGAAGGRDRAAGGLRRGRARRGIRRRRGGERGGRRGEGQGECGRERDGGGKAHREAGLLHVPQGAGRGRIGE